MTKGNLWKTIPSTIELLILNTHCEADVVIIGAGFTGCSAALHLAAAGKKVLVLEAHTIGYGGSGRNVGLVNAGLWVHPDKLDQQLGIKAGRKLYAYLNAAPERVFQLIEQYQIDCDLVRKGNLHCAHSSAGLKELQYRQQQYAERGTETILLNRAETIARTGSEQFQGALWHSSVGTIQPYKYVQGLAKAAIEAGATFYQHSPVLQIHYQNRQWQVNTAQGRITAPALLLATNAYHHALSTAADPQYALMSYFQLATESLTQAQLAVVLPQLEGCWDTGLVMTSFRLDSQGRLLIGSVGALQGMGKALHERWARRKLQQLYPNLGQCRFEHVWYGRIAKTTNAIPRMIQLGECALSIYGYSGRGIAPGTVLGQAAAEYLLSGDPSALPLPLSRTKVEYLNGLKSAYYEAGALIRHLI